MNANLQTGERMLFSILSVSVFEDIVIQLFLQMSVATKGRMMRLIPLIKGVNVNLYF